MPESRVGNWKKHKALLSGLGTGLGTFLAILVGLVAAGRTVSGVAWFIAVLAAVLAAVNSTLLARGQAKRIAYLNEEIGGLKGELAEVGERQKKGERFHLDLSEPQQWFATRDHEVDIRGRLSQEGVPNHNAVKNLNERGLSVVPFVKPLTAGLGWYSQNPAKVHQDGGISGRVSVGEPGRGRGVTYRIKLVVLESAPEPHTQNSKIPSPSYGVSNETIVDRKK